jgi:lysophospholipase
MIKKIAAIIIPMVFLSFMVFAVREDGNYVYNFDHNVMKFYNFRSVLDTFRDSNGVSIAYRVFRPVDENYQPLLKERGALVILPGRGMPMDVFAETIYDLAPLGYTIYILDHRGQGKSGRLVLNSQKQYVESFDDYVQDVDYFIKHVVLLEKHENLFLLAESMGGAIASLYMKQNPAHPFKAAVLAAPMFGVNTSPYPEFLLYGAAQLVSYFGGKECYFFGQGDYMPIAAKDSIVTKSEARYDMMKNVFEKHNCATGGVTFQWFVAAKNVVSQLENFSFNIPTLIVQAQHEHVVKNQIQNIICQRSENCNVVVIDDAYHELLLERDVVRDRLLTETMNFFKKHSL